MIDSIVTAIASLVTVGVKIAENAGAEKEAVLRRLHGELSQAMVRCSELLYKWQREEEELRQRVAEARPKKEPTP